MLDLSQEMPESKCSLTDQLEGLKLPRLDFPKTLYELLGRALVGRDGLETPVNKRFSSLKLIPLCKFYIYAFSDKPDKQIKDHNTPKQS